MSPDPATQTKEFERLVDRARRAGLLKFHHANLAVIELTIPYPTAEPPMPSAPLPTDNKECSQPGGQP